MIPELRLQGVFQCIHDLLLRDGVMAASQVQTRHSWSIPPAASVRLQFAMLLSSNSAAYLALPPCSQLPKCCLVGDGAMVCRLQVHTPPALPSRAMLDLVSTHKQCMRPALSQADAVPHPCVALSCCIVQQQSVALSADWTSDPQRSMCKHHCFQLADYRT
jgi:hypothetical protein